MRHRILISLGGVLIALVFAACTGPPGPQGEAGLVGKQGSQGEKGPQGETGPQSVSEQRIKELEGRIKYLEDSAPLVVTVTNSSDTRVGFGGPGNNTVVQRLNIDVKGPGHLQLTAYGGESISGAPYRDILARSVQDALIFISSIPASVSPSPSAFYVVCCISDRKGGAYRVPAYSVGTTYRIEEAGTYQYGVFAGSPENFLGYDSKQISVRPDTFTAVFIPD